MSCIQQESYQPQHGLKNSFKLLKKAYKKIRTSQNLKFQKHDFRSCLYEVEISFFVILVVTS